MAQFSSSLYPQTNPSNPILLDFRSNPFRRSMTQRVNDWVQYLDSPVTWRYPKPYTYAQINHARRVLTRLASFSG